MSNDEAAPLQPGDRVRLVRGTGELVLATVESNHRGVSLRVRRDGRDAKGHPHPAERVEPARLLPADGPLNLEAVPLPCILRALADAIQGFGARSGTARVLARVVRRRLARETGVYLEPQEVPP